MIDTMKGNHELIGTIDDFDKYIDKLFEDADE
jgi:hypothetical protein